MYLHYCRFHICPSHSFHSLLSHSFHLLHLSLENYRKPYYSPDLSSDRMVVYHKTFVDVAVPMFPFVHSMCLVGTDRVDYYVDDLSLIYVFPSLTCKHYYLTN